MYFFFFKQKKAYEVRPRDWSSNVCSSELDDMPEDRAQMIIQEKWQRRIEKLSSLNINDTQRSKVTPPDGTRRTNVRKSNKSKKTLL